MPRLDKDPPEGESEFANTSAVDPSVRPLLETPGGEAGDQHGSETEDEADEIRAKSVGTPPVSDRTDFRLSGTGAIETEDGLDETSEMVRLEAEDTVDDQPSEAAEDVPVFDRGENF